MDDAQFVDVVHAAGDLGTDSAGSLRGHVTFSNSGGQGGAREVLHCEIGFTVGKFPEIDHLDDVGVFDLRKELGFLQKASAADLVFGFAQDFDSEQMTKCGVAGFVNRSHSSLAGFFEHFVPTVDDESVDFIGRGAASWCFGGVVDLGGGWFWVRFRRKIPCRKTVFSENTDGECVCVAHFVAIVSFARDKGAAAIRTGGKLLLPIRRWFLHLRGSHVSKLRRGCGT